MNEVKIKEKITKLADSGMLKKIIFIAGIAGIRTKKGMRSFR